MKSVLLSLIAITMISAIGCKKHNSDSITNRFAGSWEMRLDIRTITFLDTIPPIVYKDTTAYSAGEGECIDILNNYSYVERDHAFGAIIDSGTYTIIDNRVIVKSAYYALTDTLDGSANENELSVFSSYTISNVKTGYQSVFFRR